MQLTSLHDYSRGSHCTECHVTGDRLQSYWLGGRRLSDTFILNFLHSYDQPSLKRKKRLDKRATSPKQRVLREEWVWYSPTVNSLGCASTRKNDQMLRTEHGAVTKHLPQLQTWIRRSRTSVNKDAKGPSWSYDLLQEPGDSENPWKSGVKRDRTTELTFLKFRIKTKLKMQQSCKCEFVD